MRIFLTLMSLSCFCIAQNPLDSAKNALRNAQSTTDSIKAYQDIAWYSQTQYIDSSFVYNQYAQNLIEKVGDTTAALTNKKELAGFILRDGRYEEAIDAYLEVQKEYIAIGDSLNVAKINANLGATYQSLNQTDKAMQSYIAALSYYQLSPEHKLLAASAQMNVGALYRVLGDLKMAIKNFKASEEVLLAAGPSLSLNNVQANLGYIYIDLEQYQKAEQYLLKAREDALSLGNYVTLAAIDQNLGTLSLYKEEWQEAKTYYEESLGIKKQLGNPDDTAITLSSLAAVQNELGEYDAAIKNVRESINRFEETNNYEKLVIAYPTLQISYLYKGLKDSALVYLDKYTLLNSKLFKQQAEQMAMELDKKFQTEKKDRKLAEQRSKILEQQLEAKEQETLLIIVGTIAVAAILLGILFYRQQQIKNKQLKQENELKNAQLKLESQQKLEDQRLRISRDLHDNIGSQLTFLISSLDNLRYAQHAESNITSQKLSGLSEFTRKTITELRDTIWAMNKGMISIEDLRTRISEQLNHAEDLEVNIDLEIDDAIDLQCQYSAVDGMHIFRIIQEAVNNAIKYASANNVHLAVHLKDPDKITYSITDDGKGFEKDQADNGNGLRNMRERADELNGTLNIDTEIGKGTTIKLYVNNNRCKSAAIS